MLGPKKNSYKEFDNEKKFLRLKNSPPPPPHNFSNGPSLKGPLTYQDTDTGVLLCQEIWGYIGSLRFNRTCPCRLQML